MAVGKEIRDQIRSVSSTQKITSAMEMVAASKMRRAQERMESSRPYSEKISEVIEHMAYANSEYKHPFMEAREIKRVGLILAASDRGLCGGLNINLFRQLLKELQVWKDKEIEVSFVTIGSKGHGFVSRLGAKVIANATNLGDAPGLTDFIGPVKCMLDNFDNKEIDELYVVFNEFVNSMTQKPMIKRLLPLVPDEKSKVDEHYNTYWDYIYEPDAKEVIDEILIRYVESMVYQSVVENIACEQSARMVAMKNATDNAGDLIDGLRLVYNKARQAAITAELADIVGGAAAVS